MQKERDFLLRTGMINRAVHAGMQPNDCVVWKKTPNGYQNWTICDKSCVTEVKGVPTGGNYNCEFSAVYAKGAIPKFASSNSIIRWSKITAVALTIARDKFFQHHYDAHCEKFQIPASWANAIRFELTDKDKKIESNRFGGSPEKHPECTTIMSDCQDAGMIVNLTSPGGRIMNDQKFVDAIAAKPPNILAFSFDDMSQDELRRLSKMDLDAIAAERRTIPPFWGQKQKAYEGMYAARLMKEMGVPVKILFNVVAHTGNIAHLNDILATILECVPGSLANPYPGQSFGKDLPCWTPSSLPALRKHVLNFIEGTLAGRPGVTPRLHYYEALESAFRHWSKNLGRICEFTSGIGAWDCTARPGAYRYAQIGEYTGVLNSTKEQLPEPGGHFGCAWNPGWAISKQVDELSVEEAADFMTTGVVEHGKRLAGVRKTSIMPRLMFDVICTEAGLPEELIPEYLSTRLEYSGY